MLLGKFVRIFNSLVGIKNHIEKFFAEEPESFRKHGGKDGERFRNKMVPM